MMSKEAPFKIPQDVIDSLVSRDDIVNTIGQYIKLNKQGKDYTALCPFHQEKSPSFSVSAVKQFYYCFGCGASGNSLDFKKEFLGKSFISVIQDMAEDHHVDLTPYLAMAQKGNLELRLAPAMVKASEHFSACLTIENASSSVWTYLSRRGITPEAVNRFSLGYAGNGYQIVKDFEDIKEEMILCGILENGDNGVYSQFRDRLIMPVRDVRGKPIGLSGRTLIEEVKPKYKNSKESQLFSRNSSLYGLFEALDESDTALVEHMFLVEGQVDVIACWMAGMSACAAMGSSMSQQQLRLLMRYCNRVTLMMDGDKAGIKALVQMGQLLLENLTSQDVVFDVVFLPEGEDPHSLLENDKSAMGALTSSATPWLEAFFRSLPEASDLNTDRGRAEYANRCVELIHETRDPVLRYQAVEQASAICGIPVQTLNESLINLPETRSGHAKRKSPVKVQEDTAVRLARMLWDSPRLYKHISNPTLWVEEGDSLTACLGTWLGACHTGSYDGLYNDEEIEKAVAAPEMLDRINHESRLRVAGAALGRMLGEIEIPGLMSVIMSKEPEEGDSTALAHAWHLTALCAATAMQSISSRAKMNMMSADDRVRFAELLLIRKNAAIRLKE